MLVTVSGISLEQLVNRRSGELTCLLGHGAIGLMSARNTPNAAEAVVQQLKTCSFPGASVVFRSKFDVRDFSLKSMSALAYLQRLKTRPSGRYFTLIEIADISQAGRAGSMTDTDNPLQEQMLTDILLLVKRADDCLRAQGTPYLLCLAGVHPAPAAVARNDLLVPIIMTGDRYEPGLLSSSSTRKPGIIITQDLVATILESLDAQYTRLSGATITICPTRNAPAVLLQLNSQLIATYTARAPVLTGFGVILALALSAGVCMLAFSTRRPASSGHFLAVAGLRILLTAILLAPAMLLIAPGFKIFTTTMTAVLLGVSTIVPAVIMHRCIRDTRVLLGVLGVFTAVLICADLVAGAPLMQQSILGYDAITGVRFYGLGNEYAGFLIGGMLLGMYAVLDYFASRKNRLYIPIILSTLLVCYLIGSPEFGTDFGGTIAVLAGAGLAFSLAFGGAAWKKWLAWQSAGALLLLVCMLGLNMLVPRALQSHIGKAFGVALHHPEYLGVLAMRKMAMNVGLITHHLWAVIPALLLICVGMLIYFRNHTQQRYPNSHPMMHAGFLGIMTAAITGFLVNDSGIVMLGTSLFFVVYPMLIWQTALKGYSPIADCTADAVAGQE